MKFEDVAKQLNPDIYQRFKEALELGKWPDGRVLTKEQKEICLQAVMLFEEQHDVPEAERVGYIDREKRKPASGGDSGTDSDTDTIRVLH